MRILHFCYKKEKILKEEKIYDIIVSRKEGAKELKEKTTESQKQSNTETKEKIKMVVEKS